MYLRCFELFGAKSWGADIKFEARFFSIASCFCVTGNNNFCIFLGNSRKSILSIAHKQKKNRKAYSLASSPSFFSNSLFKLIVELAVIQCPPTPNVQNAIVDCTNGNFFGSTCTFFCELGYRFFGNRTLRCLADKDGDGFGDYNFAPPQCQGWSISLV